MGRPAGSSSFMNSRTCRCFASVGEAYGVPAQEVSSREELTEALRAAIAVQEGPRLVQVPVASGMWLD